MKTQFGDFEQKYYDKEKAKIIIQPVPYDGTSTWGKGADKGPQAILGASYNLEFYDIETNSEVYKNGISTIEPLTEKSSPDAMVSEVFQSTKNILSENKFIVTIGGEHSVSIGVVKAYAEKFKNLTVLQLDAHTDLRMEYLGSKYNHACVMARIGEFCPFVQVGIRSMDIQEKVLISEDKIFYAEQIYNNEKWINEAIKQLTNNVYITIDLDVFDPSVLPATGTPEPGGLSWYMVLKFLKEVFIRKSVVGFDVVELCPHENSKPSEFLAAKLIYKLLSYKFKLANLKL